MERMQKERVGDVEAQFRNQARVDKKKRKLKKNTEAEGTDNEIIHILFPPIRRFRSGD